LRWVYHFVTTTLPDTLRPLLSVATMYAATAVDAVAGCIASRGDPYLALVAPSLTYSLFKLPLYLAALWLVRRVVLVLLRCCCCLCRCRCSQRTATPPAAAKPGPAASGGASPTSTDKPPVQLYQAYQPQPAGNRERSASQT